MEMTIDDSIRQFEDYLKWEKRLGLNGSGLDDATIKLLEVAKKYQQIEQIVEHWACCGNPSDSMIAISEVVEDGKHFKNRVDYT